ncbi:MAG: hypothetical protein KKH61_20120 [Gammaproteobacteria bacterium]|nr:hypothetical protein [Gammaproteobacteria bacterium]
MNLFETKIKEQVLKRRPDLIIEEGVFSMGEFIRAVLSVNSPEDAKGFYQGYLEYLSKFHKTEEEVERVARSNIGWCFGEGMSTEKIKMWSETGSNHPVFGLSIPTLKEAFRAGIKLGGKK